MAKVAGRGKSVIGLFVDGLDVKLAHLTARKNRIIVQELRSATLITKLQEQKPAETMAPAVGDTTDAFSLGEGTTSEAVAESQSEDNNAVLL